MRRNLISRQLSVFAVLSVLLWLRSVVGYYSLSAYPWRAGSKLFSIPSRTETIFRRTLEVDESGGAGGASSFQKLLFLDNAWAKLRSGGWKDPIPALVQSLETENYFPATGRPDFDVVVFSGILGSIFAYALQDRGFKVAIIERGLVKGRSQEWNISRKELDALVRMNLLTESELTDIISIHFNPVRVGFHTDTSINAATESEGIFRGNGFEMKTTDVLNLGVKPDRLIEKVTQKFTAAGGIMIEQCQVDSVSIYQDVALVHTKGTQSKEEDQITTRLIVDAMGNGSPIARQIRGNVEPDGICIVVGSCARGFNPANNTYSDVIYTDSPLRSLPSDLSSASSQLQFFWEAFPAGSGPSDRTTYLFTYLDAKPQRPSILSIFEDYWELLPRYQGKEAADLEFVRVLFGLFPTYRRSPIQSPFSRIIQVGDASGIQSPLSFGGFGSLTRHLQRITDALCEALSADLLTCQALNRINAYQPNLSVSWMFQRAMSVAVDYKPSSDRLVTDTLSSSFAAMESLGERTFRPFLQDVLQFGPLLRTLALAFWRDPLIPVKVVPQVGVAAIADFVLHFTSLGMFTCLFALLGTPLRRLSRSSRISEKQRYFMSRWYDQLKYGSGLDYFDHD